MQLSLNKIVLLSVLKIYYVVVIIILSEVFRHTQQETESYIASVGVVDY